MMRRPSDRNELYAWHAKAMAALAAVKKDDLKAVAAEAYELLPSIQEWSPQCGWFKAIFRRDAVAVPAKIFMKSVVDDDGELVEPELLMCEVGDAPVDVMEAWPKLCTRPISRAEYLYLMSVRTWAQESAPNQPQARDGRPIDWLTVKLPPVPPSPSPEKPRRKS